MKLRRKKKKPIEPICKCCRLFSPKEKRCNVIVLHEGQRFNLPVDADDKCFFEDEFKAISDTGETESFKPEVQQVKFWLENPTTGKKTNTNGVLKIEYPEGFFGDEEKRNMGSF